MRRLAIIGVGLIGGSLARALRASGSIGEIIGCGRNEEQLERAVELGIIDRYSTDAAKAVDGAEMVVIGAPVGAMETILETIRPRLADGAVITDVGSTKGSVVEAARRVFGVRCPPGFVPGHPIAGTERNGVEASFAELFQQRRVILTPLPETDADATAAVRTMWEKAGAVVETMTPEHHDEVFAATSHLPHLLAYGLVNTLATLDEKVEIFRYAAGGFRDFTRIASSNPRMWHDICLANRDALLTVMDRFENDLHRIRQAVEAGEGEYLLEVFERAKEARDRFVDKAEE